MLPQLARSLALVAAGGLAISCATRPPQDLADTIYTGGMIVTVNDAQPTASALAVKNGTILAVGDQAEVLAFKGSTTNVVDLDGKTMLPGFIDSHGHVFNVGVRAVAANPLARPDGTVTDDDQVILRIVHEVANRAREGLPLIRRSVARRAGAPDTGLAPGARQADVPTGSRRPRRDDRAEGGL
jgi:imidazolonepropionase-like amidohydrolase